MTKLEKERAPSCLAPAVSYQFDIRARERFGRELRKARRGGRRWAVVALGLHLDIAASG